MLCPQSNGDLTVESESARGESSAALDSRATPLSIDEIGHERLEGRLIWQNPEFLAVEVNNSSEPTLINLSQMSIIRPLG